MNNQEIFDFCLVLFKTKFERIKVSILYSRFGPIWQLYDRNTKETRWQRFSATFVSDACHRKTWDMFERFKEEVQKNIRALKTFEEDYLIRDIVLLKEEEPIFNGIPIPLDLESKAEEEKKKACDLKKERAWKNPSMEMITARMNSINHMLSYPYSGFHFPLEKTKRKSDEDLDDRFVYRGTERRIRFEEKEKRFAIYNTITRNSGSIVLGTNKKVNFQRMKEVIIKIWLTWWETSMRSYFDLYL